MAGTKVFKLLTAGFLFATPALSSAQISCESVLLSSDVTSPQKAAIQALLENPLLAKSLGQKQLEALVLQYASAILKVPVTDIIATKKVSPLQIKDLGESGTTPQEAMALAHLGKLSEQGQLQPAVLQLLAFLKSKAETTPQLAQLKNLSPEQETF